MPSTDWSSDSISLADGMPRSGGCEGGFSSGWRVGAAFVGFPDGSDELLVTDGSGDGVAGWTTTVGNADGDEDAVADVGDVAASVLVSWPDCTR